ncbi:MAG: 2-hydroxymuconic semialdehyde dehydrogenase [Candidatus Sericytochromatia bacterium]|nr:2-hydroxymuconic semialdehyde dehydrogenase [Candidatus Tanganyikabacteria bacterium]
MRRYRHYIAGEFCDGAGGSTFADVDPATARPIAEVALGTADDVDRAVAAASGALAGPWGRMPVGARCDLLRRAADILADRSADFVAAEVADTGKPLAWARDLEIPRAAANFRAYSDLMRGWADEAFQTPTDDGRGATNYTVRAPLGAVGVIVPWNLPLLLLTWKVAPALAAGNAVIAKPSEETPGTATLLAEVLAEAGLPAGAYNVVHGMGPGGAGEALVTHPGVRAIAFTGESRTGQAIMRAASDRLKPLSFELGGKNAALVFADADFDAAVAGVARSTFSNTGQVCLCTERVYVERSLYDRFVAALAEAARVLVPGDPLDPATTLGPLISRTHLEKVTSYFDLARREGATSLTGGSRPDLPAPFDGGYFVQPTIWVDLPESARCAREEVFGPVCHVRPFDDEDEAIALANASEYGLAATVWTRDLSRAHRVAKRLEAGITWVNCWYLRDLRTPFGGMKNSGIGREGGRYSLEFFSEIKNICIKH